MLSKLSLFDEITGIIRRRVWYFLIPFVFLVVFSGAVVLALPTTYISTGKIGVESQQIPTDFVRSTITTVAGERVGMIEARVMTASHLKGIIERLRVYTADWDSAPRAKLAARMKKHAVIEVIGDPYARRLGAIAFTVAFEHEDPQTARAVSAELVRLFLEENESTRRERARKTTEFLSRQADKLGEEAQAIDQEIAEFKRLNSHALPEHLELKTAMLTRAEADLRAVKIEISTVQQERRFIDTQRDTAKGLSVVDGTVIATSPAAQLQAKKAELAEKSVKYSSGHWDIRRLEGEVAELKLVVAQGGSPETDSTASLSDPALAKYKSRRHTTTTRLNSLRDREKNLRESIATLEDDILEIPLVEIELRRLTDEYNVFMEEYGEIRGKRYDAALALSLEQEEKAERFILLEPPEIPLEPTRSILKLLVLALLFSFAGSAGIAYLAELLDDRIYGQNMLASLTGQQPLAVIPHLEGMRGV